MNKLKIIFKDNWKSIIFSYSLFSINSILMLIYPKVLGNAIDHMILRQYSYIWYLVLTFGLMMFFGYISRIYDVKIFSGIYRKFSSNEINKQIDNGVETTKINGRLTMMSYIVNFFEFDMINVLQTTFGVIGSLYFLSLVSWKVVGFLLISGVAIIGTSYYYSPKLADLTRQTNDISEEQTDIISQRKIGLINNLLRKTQKISIRRANINTNFYLIIQFIVYGSVTSILTYYVMYNRVTIGSVFSTYRYMFDFCNSLLGLPAIMTSYLNIKDVIKRLDE